MGTTARIDWKRFSVGAGLSSMWEFTSEVGNVHKIFVGIHYLGSERRRALYFVLGPFMLHVSYFRTSTGE